MEKSKLKYFKQIAVLFCIVLMMSLFSGMAQCKDSISEDGGKGLFAPVTEFADYFISERGQILFFNSGTFMDVISSGSFSNTSRSSRCHITYKT